MRNHGIQCLMPLRTCLKTIKQFKPVYIGIIPDRSKFLTFPVVVTRDIAFFNGPISELGQVLYAKLIWLAFFNSMN